MCRVRRFWNTRAFIEQWSEWRMEAGESPHLDAQDGVLVVRHIHATGKRAALKWR